MITLVIVNVMTDSQREYKISKMEDFDLFEKEWGPQIKREIYKITDPKVAAQRVARCLSNHHLNAYVIDETDKE